MIKCDTIQYRKISYNSMYHHTVPYIIIKFNSLACAIIQYHSIPNDDLQYHVIPYIKYNVISSNTKHDDEHDNKFCSNIIISIVTYHRQIMVVTLMNMSHARMTQIPNTMMKMTIDYVQTSSFL